MKELRPEGAKSLQPRATPWVSQSLVVTPCKGKSITKRSPRKLMVMLLPFQSAASLAPLPQGVALG